MKFAFIDEMAGKNLWWFSVALACELPVVSPLGSYEWRARRTRPTTTREREQQLLLAAIVVEHIDSKRRYGSPRIHTELRAQGWRVEVNRIARLVAEQGIEGHPSRRRRHSLTRQATVAPDIPDLLQRDFTAATPDTRGISDIGTDRRTMGAFHRSSQQLLIFGAAL